MSKSMPATFETRERAQLRARHEASVARDVDEVFACVDDLTHLLRVVLPIRCQSEHTIRRDDLRQQCNERWLNQATLVMAFLVPRIREENVYEIDRARSELIAQNFYRVTIEHADIAQRCRVSAQHQVTDTGSMHFDAKTVDVRIRLRECEQGFTRAETDFEHARCCPAEHAIKIERPGLFDTVCRPQLLERPLLRDGRTSGTNDKAANAATRRGRSRIRGRVVQFCFH